MKYRFKINKKLFTIVVIICFCILPRLCAQQNKPVSNAVIPSPTVTVATVPAAYPTGVSGNYTRIKSAKAPMIDIIDFNNQGYKEVKVATQFSDGLGRPLQTVIKQITPGPTPKDVVGVNLYNEFGLHEYRYLPYASTEDNGSFKMDPFNDQETFMQAKYPGEAVFYGKAEFDNSPLKRHLKLYAQGNSWAGSNRGRELKNEFNTSADDVRIWTIPYTTNPLNNYPSTTAEYPAGELAKHIVIDEDGKATVEYIDKEGKLILKKVQVNVLTTANDYTGYTNWLSTYYVYDDFNRLRFVIPPKAVKEMVTQTMVTWSLTTPDLTSNLCFWYVYDERGRITAKKVPDADWIFFVYDNRDRPVFVQDGNMRINKKWYATLYDELNRAVLTGIITYPSGAGPGDWNDLANLQLYVTSNTGSGTNSSIAISQTTASTVSSDITINSLQTNSKNYKATNQISFETGFATDENTDLVAEIVSGSNTTVTENVVINDNPLPTGHNLVALTLKFYDEYNFKNKSNSNFVYSTANNSYLDAANNLHADALPDATQQAKVLTRGIVTGSKVRVISDPNSLSSGVWLSQAVFYDEKGRAIQMQRENYSGGDDIVTNRYNFSGNLLSSYYSHSNPKNTDASLQTIAVKTNALYDHAGRLLEVRKKINNDASTERAILRNEYDELGTLKKNSVGGVPGLPADDPDDIENYLQSYSKNPLEILNYDFNIRGWLKGINKDYANGSGSNDSWFGMELSYDWGFGTDQFNGNISGTKWRSKGDEELRAYGYAYDIANRLQFADFSQKTSGNYGDDPTINLDMQLGSLSGGNWVDSYDDNGNIIKMKQWGLKVTSSSVVDDLTYTYNSYSNKLKNVIDLNNEPATLLGDFRSSQTYMTALGGIKTTAAIDYEYDLNGNIKKDLNKDITDASVEAIQYNHLNLPWKIVLKNKGTVTYIYDAAGTKLEKITTDNTTPPPGQPNRSKSTVYLNGFTYQNNELKFFGHEKGRVRVTTKSGDPTEFNYDYFIKDNLGNIRVVLTDEIKQDQYPAVTLENSAVGVEGEYYNIQSGNIVPKSTIPNFSNTTAYPNNNGNPPHNPNPTSDVNATSDKLYKLNGSTGNITGLGITLKVMTGDVVDIFGKSYYHVNGPIDNTYTLSSILTSFINVFAGTSAVANSGKNVTGTLLNNSSGTTGPLNTWFQNMPSSTTKPKAYINWILFDEQFRPVDGSSGFSAVSDNSDELKDHYKNLDITKSGYLYVYCSNESNQNVFFDNLQLIHTRGPLLETNEYYPFGLIASGISYKAAGSLENKNKFSSNELQSGEFAEGTGLEFYDFNARMYDAQIGRFMAIDPLADLDDSQSPFDYARNNPINYTDPSGLMVYMDPELWEGEIRSEQDREDEARYNDREEESQRDDEFNEYFRPDLNPYPGEEEVRKLIKKGSRLEAVDLMIKSFPSQMLGSNRHLNNTTRIEIGARGHVTWPDIVKDANGRNENGSITLYGSLTLDAFADGELSYGMLLRTIVHERRHALSDRFPDPNVNTRGEREFIAYFYMFTVKGLPDIDMDLPGDKAQITAEKTIVKGYFDAIDPRRQSMHKANYDELQRFFDELLKK